MTSPRFPEPPPSHPPTPLDQIDRLLARLDSKKDAWLQVTIAQRIAFLDAARTALQAEAAGWAAAISKVKGLSPDEQLHGEDWLTGPMTLARNVRLLIDALKADGQPRP